MAEDIVIQKYETEAIQIENEEKWKKEKEELTAKVTQEVEREMADKKREKKWKNGFSDVGNNSQ